MIFSRKIALLPARRRQTINNFSTWPLTPREIILCIILSDANEGRCIPPFCSLHAREFNFVFCYSFFLLRPERICIVSRRPQNSDYSIHTLTRVPPNNLHAQRNKTFNLLIMIQWRWRLRVGRPSLCVHHTDGIR
jgi:hypothetical protein